MAWKRRFVEWNQSAIARAVDLLLGDRRSTKTWDLSDSLVVLPFESARHSLSNRIQSEATLQQTELIPPRIVTLLQVESLFVVPEVKFASPVESRLAWYQVFQSADPSLLRKIIRRIPAADDWTNWSSLASEAFKLRRILGHQRMTIEKAFKTDAVQNSSEKIRWEGLAELEGEYRRRLNQNDRVDLFDHLEEVLSDNATVEVNYSRILLAAIPCLSSLQHALLMKMADRSSILSMVFASKDHEEGFDPTGCLIPSYWRNVETRIPDKQIIVTESPSDEVKVALVELSKRSEELLPHDVRFGVGDESVLPRLLRHAARANVPITSSQDCSCERWLPLELLRQLTRYSHEEKAVDFASLIRHPDLLDWLTKDLETPGKAGSEFVQYVDKYRSTQLPLKLSLSRLDAEKHQTIIVRLKSLVDAFPVTKQLVSDWIATFEFIFAIVYRAAEASSRSSDTSHALSVLSETFSELKSSSKDLFNECSAEEGLSVVEASLDEKLDGARSNPNSTHAMPWDELFLADAKQFFVLGMNEGKLPTRQETSLFLSPEIRRGLAIPGLVEEGAKQRYLLCSIVRSHPEVMFIVGRRSADGDPYLIHRLLLDGSPQQKAERLLRYFRDPSPKIQWKRTLANPIRIGIPEPEDHPTIDELSVTAFRDYLACPYRFYLRHIMKLELVDDEPAELDPLSFGNLIHDILNDFGNSKVATSHSKDEIFAHLETLLVNATKVRFSDALPAVAVQIEQIHARLEAYASWQAKWAAQGWRIRNVEVTTRRRSAHLDVDGQPFYLSGRIDRIDINTRTGQLAVMDYKTSESGQSPDKIHRGKEGWTDLQLPLYRHLLPAIPQIRDDLKQSTIVLAYMVLPKDIGKVDFLEADWTTADLKDADETAIQIIREIRKKQFLRLSADAASKFPEFARICQDGMVTHD
ncbi:PD-(D/E)XK nuclease family protein [bacterium]|nr:PD-(D/E)XK nuclease family protein [bacterium]